MATPAFGTNGATPQSTSLGSLQNLGIFAPRKNVSNTPTTPYTPPTGGPTLNSNPMGNPSAGIIGSINSAVGLPTPPTSIVGDGQVGPLASKTGLLTSTPSTPLKKTTTTNADGSSTSQEYHAPTTSSSDSDTSNTGTKSDTTKNGTTSSNAPGTGTTAPVTASSNPIDNAQNLLNVSGGDTAGQGAANAAGLFGAMGNIAGLQPFANGTIQGLDQSFANLSRPQSTGNLAGEEGLFNTQNAIFQNAANTSAAQALANKGLATQGAQGVLNASLPQFNVSPGNVVGQPLQTGGGVDSNYLGGIAAPANIASVQTYTTQNNTIGNSIEKLDNIANGNNGSGGLIANMGTENFNPLNTPIGNQTYSNYYKNLNPAAQAGIQAGLGDIANNVSTVLSSVTGLTPTAVSAIVDSYDFQDLTPQQLNDFLVYVKGYANNAIQANTDSINNIKSGNSVSASNAPLPAPSPNSIGSAALGTGATLAEGLVNKLGASLSGAASDAVAGAVGGVASTAAAAGGSLFGSFFP